MGFPALNPSALGTKHEFLSTAPKTPGVLPPSHLPKLKLSYTAYTGFNTDIFPQMSSPPRSPPDLAPVLIMVACHCLGMGLSLPQIPSKSWDCLGFGETPQGRAGTALVITLSLVLPSRGPGTEEILFSSRVCLVSFIRQIFTEQFCFSTAGT